MAARPARHGPLNQFGPRAASKLAFLVATLLCVALLSLAIRAAQAPVNLTGTWHGTASDFWEKTKTTDGMNVTWVLTQSGSAVSGTVTSTALNPNDNSCSSCHRAKGGTVSGTVSGSELTVTLDFPGLTGEITPTCSVVLNGTGPVGNSTLTTLYTLVDSCEGQFTNGVLTMAREGGSSQPFTNDPLVAGVTVVRAAHIAELRTRINAVRYRWQLLPYSYSDADLMAGATHIRAQHLIDLRTALSEAYVAAGQTPPTYTDPDLIAGGFIKRVHIAELRAALVLIE